MTEAEAKELNRGLIDVVAGLPDGRGLVSIIDANVEFETEPVMMHFLTDNGREMTSRKAANVRFNLRETLLSGLAMLLAAEVPNAPLAVAVACLTVVGFLNEASSVTLSEDEASMVLYLHEHDGYSGIEEDMLAEKYARWCGDRLGEAPKPRAIGRAIGSLVDLKTIEVVDGTVFLKEKLLYRK